MKIHYLGPEGTFTHEAASKFFSPIGQVELIASKSIPSILSEIESEDGALGVVPFENSVHGIVIPTLDSLIFDHEKIKIVGEVSIPVTFGAYCKIPDPKNIDTVISHPHALAQCRQFITDRGLLERTANSTADACKLIAEGNDTAIVAIASSAAAKKFGLHPLSENIEDYLGAVTRFFVLGLEYKIPKFNHRSLIALLPPRDDVGTIAEFSQVFQKMEINIYEIHTRPTKKSLGQYIFILSLGSDVSKGDGYLAMTKLVNMGYQLRIVGMFESDETVHPEAPYAVIPGLKGSENFEEFVASKFKSEKSTA